MIAGWFELSTKFQGLKAVLGHQPLEAAALHAATARGLGNIVASVPHHLGQIPRLKLLNHPALGAAERFFGGARRSFDGFQNA